MTSSERENLPLWMQKTMRGTDWGVLIVIAFSLLAAWAFLLQSGLPRTNASEHYVYRAANTVSEFRRRAALSALVAERARRLRRADPQLHSARRALISRR